MCRLRVAVLVSEALSKERRGVKDMIYYCFVLAFDVLPDPVLPAIELGSVIISIPREARPLHAITFFQTQDVLISKES